MKLVVDMSSIMWTCLLAGKDQEGCEVFEPVEGRKHWVNTADYGYENAVNSLVSSLKRFECTPIDMILVIEGLNAKAQRLMINKEYKSKRGKRPIESYDEFNKLKSKLVETFSRLGAIVFQQDNVEADDAIAWLCKNAKEHTVVMSNDNDLAALTGVNAHGTRINTFIGGEVDVNRYGMFPFEFITLYKSMVGDTGDSIKGIKGFGKEAWIDFHSQFGEDGMAEMVRLAELGSLADLEEEAESNKLIKKIWEGRDEFLNSWRLASMHPEWVDTMDNAPIWLPGMVAGEVKDDRLAQWVGKGLLVTADNWGKFRERFLATYKARPWIALDIETSTPDESDEWLAAQGNPDGVDVIGSELTGMSLTFGSNMQYTVYISIDHAETNNVSKTQVRQLLEEIQASGTEIVIQNVSFEGTVLFNEFGEHWKDNGYHGLLANWLDTKFEASYVDENDSLGLKKLSRKWLNYDQVEYKTVTTVDGVQYKMRELTAKHVFSYACDDTICTAALHNFFKLFMELEGTYDVYKKVEIDASYLHTQSFIHGTKISLPTLAELRKEDDEVYDQAWVGLRDYLIAQGWAGTKTPVYSGDLSAAQIKEIAVICGNPLETSVRTPAKLLAMLTDALLRDSLEKALAGEFAQLNELVASRFNGEPEFNMGSPKQKVQLLYEVMGLPIRVYNKPTAQMKAAGIKQGSPKTDNLAIMYAMLDAAEDQKAVLEHMRVMQMVATRRSLYYDTYPYFVHWKTGRVHSSHNQCATNTRRASSSAPNLQQLSKNQKVEGFSPRVRELIVPHKKNAVIVSMDFMAQELRVIADYSQDPNMVACFIGEHLKDMHALTGVGIYNKRNPQAEMSYESFVGALDDKNHEMYKDAKKMRALGKQCNFTTEFGAQAAKLSMTMFVTEEEAQTYIDAKEAAFPVVVKWKDEVQVEAKKCGYVRTKLGAKRHLRELFRSTDRYVASKADRQAVNFKVQGSSAEMTKLAEGRMWRAGLEQHFDCEVIAPIHDEIVASIVLDELFEFIPAMHMCMEQPYADMKIPVKSSISFGPTFGPAHQIEIGDVPSREAVENGLKQMEKLQ